MTPCIVTHRACRSSLLTRKFLMAPSRWERMHEGLAVHPHHSIIVVRKLQPDRMPLRNTVLNVTIILSEGGAPIGSRDVHTGKYGFIATVMRPASRSARSSSIYATA